MNAGTIGAGTAIGQGFKSGEANEIQPIESTPEALFHHFGRHLQGALCGAQPRVETLGYNL
jgi:hypothetical protein